VPKVHIRVGRGTNLQDDTIVHVNRNGTPAIVSPGTLVPKGSLLMGTPARASAPPTRTSS
jgi:carbonic anhydrase/acetyltransferase-like protein (isoleucine patch superfamily)